MELKVFFLEIVNPDLDSDQVWGFSIFSFCTLPGEISGLPLLSTRVYERRAVTGREHFTCQSSGASQIFIPRFCGGKILSDVNVVVRRRAKGETVLIRLPSASQKRACVKTVPTNHAFFEDN